MDIPVVVLPRETEPVEPSILSRIGWILRVYGMRTEGQDPYLGQKIAQY